VARGFEQVRLASGHTPERITGAHLRNSALVAVNATIVAHLEEERAVAEPVTALNALRASDAQLLVNGVLEVGVLDVTAPDRGGRTQAILRAGIQVVGFGFEIAGAKLAVATESVGVNAFDGRLFEDAMGGTISTAHALLRIDLPHRALGATAAGDQSDEAAQCADRGYSRSVAEELPATDGRFG